MTVTLSRMSGRDLPLTLSWAQNKMIWEFMPTSRRDETLTWESHYNWWLNRDAERYDWMIMFDGRPVGVIHVNNMKGPNTEIGLYIGETGLWGNGIGKEALRQAITICAKYNVEVIHAVIHPKNKRSIRLFAGMGFVKLRRGRNGQDVYKLGSTVRCERAVSTTSRGNRFSGQLCAEEG